jgi:hypothetical protein
MVSETIRAEVDIPADDCYNEELVSNFESYSDRICPVMA